MNLIYFEVSLVLVGLLHTDFVWSWTADGTNFIVVCPSLPQNSPSIDCILHVMGSEGTVLNLSGSLPGLPRTETVSAGLVSKIIIQGDYSTSQVVVLTADAVISVFVETQGSGSSVYLAIPETHDLTTPYSGAPIVNYYMSFPIAPTEKNTLIVSSAYVGTDLTLTFKASAPFTHNGTVYSDGQTLATTLGFSETLEIVTDEDLTGTHVSATKPVSLFTGTKVQSTLEQIPPVSKWESLLPIPILDYCNSVLIRVLASKDGTTITIRDNIAPDDNILKNSGEYTDWSSNETTLISGDTILAGARCKIGPSDDPYTLFFPGLLAFKNEFKCFALPGYNNTVYLVNTHLVDADYDVGGATVTFKLISTYTGNLLSTMRLSVNSAYFAIKESGNFIPFVTGISLTGEGAYGYPCALGSLGSSLPDPSHSLVNIPLAVYTPATSSDFLPTTTALETSPFAIMPSSVGVQTSVNTPTELATSSPTIQSVTTTDIAASPTVAVPSTALSTDVVKLNELCFCGCLGRRILPNETEKFLEEFDIEIKRNLTLDIKLLSAYIRTKTSADDPRPSAQNVGYFGIAMLCACGSVLLFSDFLSIFKITSSIHKKTVPTH